MNSSEMLTFIINEYPSVPPTHHSKIQIGQAMKELGFESYNHSNINYYYAVPLKAA